MISKLDMADRILSLTTIGTPHRGSPIADLVGAAAPPGFDPVVERAGIDIKVITVITPDGITLRSTPVAIGLYSPESGQSATSLNWIQAEGGLWIASKVC